jgi:hypothetical protein
MKPLKIHFHGLLTAIQPRIRLTRSYDQRHHTYLGYALRINGTIGTEQREFLVGIGKETQAKHALYAGCEAHGECEPVVDPRMESVEFYKVSGLEIMVHPTITKPDHPPWQGVPLD